MATTGSDPTVARTLLVVVVVAIALRAAAAWLTIDIPGDGPSRAGIAYRWSLSPKLIRSGVWLPGFTYLAGSVCMLIPNPRIAPRLLNVILGSASIPLLYVVTRRLYGNAVGLSAAALLAILPLHVGLSASSLTEAGLVFGMLAVLCTAYGAAEARWPWSILSAAGLVLFAVFIEMIRYEAWLLLPAVVAYVAYRRRSLVIGLALAIVLSVFPVLWTMGNHSQAGNALLGFSAAVTDVENGTPASPFMAVRLLWRTLRAYLGPLAALLMCLGGGAAAIRVVRRETSAEEMLHIALAAIAWALVFGLILQRGQTVWGRLYILAIVLTLPLAAAWIGRRVADGRMRGAVVAACLVFTATAYATYQPTIFVTSRRPTEIAELIVWRDGSIYRSDAVLLTRMNWEATYLPHYSPDLSGHTIIVSSLEGDAIIGEFIRGQQPGLLVTRPEDVELLPRVERLLGGAIGPQHLVKTIGTLQVFDIRHLTRTAPPGPDGAAPPR